MPPGITCKLRGVPEFLKPICTNGTTTESPFTNGVAPATAKNRILLSNTTPFVPDPIAPEVVPVTVNAVALVHVTVTRSPTVLADGASFESLPLLLPGAVLVYSSGLML